MEESSVSAFKRSALKGRARRDLAATDNAPPNFASELYPMAPHTAPACPARSYMTCKRLLAHGHYVVPRKLTSIARADKAYPNRILPAEDARASTMLQTGANAMDDVLCKKIRLL
ncbi:uncharacterized protein PAN0_002d0928 [Moesziomyces antarcticus]|uniref:uncharacterized protein n=1 Tax=Pseudozyma antarctica TaxID=84753 RepID=UPI00071969FF|nr:uncharacterized protein PAN0_002d0928 [Moesziomyces antarcticus]GAK62726.1 hypothetical protein PAN0_002d0928 [Moesziomyces antarcticus]